jgi:1,2-phenylacetyl-CoA epoxidase catalytic subunit
LVRVSRTKERKIRQKWLDGVRKELREREKNQKPKPDLALKPPVLVNDPQTRRLARLAIANEKRLERLDGRHHGEAVKMLQKFEQELAEKANDLGSKAAEQEKHRGREQEKHRSKADDFDRFR